MSVHAHFGISHISGPEKATDLVCERVCLTGQ